MSKRSNKSTSSEPASKKVKGVANVRRSLISLQQDYDAGNRQPLEDLVRAWIAIKALPASDERSFFYLGGIHGLPFILREGLDKLEPYEQYPYWGGWCNHGNVLFPTWHRAYVLALEKALQTIVPGVMMPYWDETNEDSLEHGIPSILTQEKFTLDGQSVDNPLRSFKFPVAVQDPSEPSNLYAKPKGYETKRFPLSGLVGTPEAAAKSAKHNAKFPSFEKNVALLNTNVTKFLNNGRTTAGTPANNPSTLSKFQNCMQAPNFTVFSNTTSMSFWNLQNPGNLVMALEAPHNDIHLAVGGFDIEGQGQSGFIAGANGDMGENETAGLDPIFFFHHCNIDRVFWLWQEQHGATDKLEVMQDYPGTNNATDGQGPTPEVQPSTTLTFTSPLRPFLKPLSASAASAGAATTSKAQSDADSLYYTSMDMVNIASLGYTYERGSLADPPKLRAAAKAIAGTRRALKVTGIDRAYIQGSFIVRAMARGKGKGKGKGAVDRVVGTHSVLSRGDVTRCANCMTHLLTSAVFSLDGFEKVKSEDFYVVVDTRSPPIQPLTINTEVVTV